MKEYSTADYLDSKELREAYKEAALESNDPELIKLAEENIQKAEQQMQNQVLISEVPVGGIFMDSEGDKFQRINETQFILLDQNENPLGAAHQIIHGMVTYPVTPTPANNWSLNDEPDPHEGHYDGERSKLSLGHMTDDALANAAFMNYDQRPSMSDILAGRGLMPIVYMTAVKDRIRWLSRALTKALEARNQMDADNWAELHRLREEVKGPEGFATWAEAAGHEKAKRIAAEEKLKERQPWIPYLSDRADGVKGHYAIARWNTTGFREVWNTKVHKWSSFSDGVLTLEQAEALLKALVIPTETAVTKSELSARTALAQVEASLEQTCRNAKSQRDMGPIKNTIQWIKDVRVKHGF